MNYDSALKALYSLSPKGIRLGLDRVEAAAALLGNPQKNLYCVQVAGTNGKGTVAKTVAHAAVTTGLKVGLFTSPHLHRFTERFEINDKEVRRKVLHPHLERVLGLLDKSAAPRLTFFEVATLATFCLFEAEGVDLAVLEVGLGGRLDATTIAPARVTAITSIGMDHMDYLGETIEEIAKEKACIARPDIPMVVAALEKPAGATVDSVTKRVGAPLEVLGKDFQIDPNIAPPLPGEHQVANTAVAMRLFEHLEAQFAGCTRDVFARSLETASWPGRFEIIPGEPRFILDGAHNLEATEALVQTLRDQSIRPDTIIFGALKGKPYDKMLDLLRPLAKEIILAPPPISRAADPASFALPTDTVASGATEALEWAKANGHNTVLVTGSLFIVGAVRALLLNEPTDPPIGL